MFQLILLAGLICRGWIRSSMLSHLLGDTFATSNPPPPFATVGARHLARSISHNVVVAETHLQCIYMAYTATAHVDKVLIIRERDYSYTMLEKFIDTCNYFWCRATPRGFSLIVS